MADLVGTDGIADAETLRIGSIPTTSAASWFGLGGPPGQPIAGATVSTQPATASVTTDAQGNYTIPDVAPGGYTVNAAKTGYQNGSASATVVAGQTAIANIALTPLPGTISGRVTDASNSQPIAGATVSTQPATTTVTTNAQGNYTIPNVAPGGYTVNASKSGYQNGSANVTVTADQTVTANIALTPVINYDGSWSGTTSQNESVSFTIVNNALTELSIRVRLTGALCNVSVTFTFSFPTPRPITGNTFSFTSASPIIGSVSGTFSSNTSASGTWSFTWLHPTCAAVSGSGTWTATKQ